MAREAVGFWGLAARRCDSCKSSPAVLFCGADSAYLCGTCDSRVHAANRLASGHGRVWMCEVCEQAPAAVTCKADAATLCIMCDADIHAANPLASRHERIPVAPFYEPLSSVIKPSAAGARAVAASVLEEHNESEAATWMMPNPGPGPGLNQNPNPKGIMEALDLNFFADVDPFLDIDYADSLVPVQEKPVARGGAPTLPATMAPDGVVEIDFALGKPSHSSYNTYSMSYSVSSSEVGVVPDGGVSSMADVSNPYGGPAAAAAANPTVAMDREARVMRYREKRKNRKFQKTIRYASRKAYAETRPRIKGRFAKRVDTDPEADRIYAPASLGAAIMVDNGYGVVPSF